MIKQLKPVTRRLLKRLYHWQEKKVGVFFRITKGRYLSGHFSRIECFKLKLKGVDLNEKSKRHGLRNGS